MVDIQSMEHHKFYEALASEGVNTELLSRETRGVLDVALQALSYPTAKKERRNRSRSRMGDGDADSPRSKSTSMTSDTSGDAWGVRTVHSTSPSSKHDDTSRNDERSDSKWDFYEGARSNEQKGGNMKSDSMNVRQAARDRELEDQLAKLDAAGSWEWDNLKESLAPIYIPLGGTQGERPMQVFAVGGSGGGGLLEEGGRTSFGSTPPKSSTTRSTPSPSVGVDRLRKTGTRAGMLRDDDIRFMPLDTPPGRLTDVFRELAAMRHTIRASASIEDLLPPHPRPRPSLDISAIQSETDDTVRFLKTKVFSSASSLTSTAPSSRHASPLPRADDSGASDPCDFMLKLVEGLKEDRAYGSKLRVRHAVRSRSASPPPGRASPTEMRWSVRGMEMNSAREWDVAKNDSGGQSRYAQVLRSSFPENLLLSSSWSREFDKFASERRYPSVPREHHASSSSLSSSQLRASPDASSSTSVKHLGERCLPPHLDHLQLATHAASRSPTHESSPQAPAASSRSLDPRAWVSAILQAYDTLSNHPQASNHSALPPEPPPYSSLNIAVPPPPPPRSPATPPASASSTSPPRTPAAAAATPLASPPRPLTSTPIPASPPLPLAPVPSSSAAPSAPPISRTEPPPPIIPRSPLPPPPPASSSSSTFVHHTPSHAPYHAPIAPAYLVSRGLASLSSSSVPLPRIPLSHVHHSSLSDIPSTSTRRSVILPAPAGLAHAFSRHSSLTASSAPFPLTDHHIAHTLLIESGRTGHVSHLHYMPSAHVMNAHSSSALAMHQAWDRSVSDSRVMPGTRVSVPDSRMVLPLRRSWDTESEREMERKGLYLTLERPHDWKSDGGSLSPQTSWGRGSVREDIQKSSPISYTEALLRTGGVRHSSHEGGRTSQSISPAKQDHVHTTRLLSVSSPPTHTNETYPTITGVAVRCQPARNGTVSAIVTWERCQGEGTLYEVQFLSEPDGRGQPNWRTVHFGSLRECSIAGLKEGERCKLRARVAALNIAFGAEIEFTATS